MTKRKYSTDKERQEAQSRSSREQMLKQWEEKRRKSESDLGYYGCHRRVRTARGPAKMQECLLCGQGAQHWAHVHDTDPTKPINYIPICQKCHFEYDRVGARSASAFKNKRMQRLAALKMEES